IDLTPPEEGYQPPDLGGAELKAALLELLPAAYRQTILTLQDAAAGLRDMYERRALPIIVGASTLAATAAAVPVPWIDLPVVAGIQTRLVYQLAELYGQPAGG